MTIEELILEKLRELPPEKQNDVLNYVESLRNQNGAKEPFRSLAGLWADLGFHVTAEDIAEARSEMWGNFPRDVD